MIVHPIASAPEMTDILVFDDVCGEWRVAHQRDYDGEASWIDGNVVDAADMLDEGCALSVFMEVTHWSPLPPLMGRWA